MKKIAVTFDDPHPMGAPFSDANYWDTYKKLYQFSLENDVELRFVRGVDQYVGEMRFASWYSIQKEEPVLHNTEWTADLIYLKGLALEPDASALTLNHWDIHTTCIDKIATAKRFPEFSKKSFTVTEKNAQDIPDKIKSDKVVVKPIEGSEGRDVLIIDREAFDPASIRKTLQKTEDTFLAQEFIDSSDGIPGITDGHHDLRLFIFNGEVKQSYVRIPPEGSLLANIALGAKAVPLEPSQIPESAMNVVTYIEKDFHKYTPRLYTVDLMFEDGKPYLVELNDQPGIPYGNLQRFCMDFYRNLVDLFLSVK